MKNLNKHSIFNKLYYTTLLMASIVLNCYQLYTIQKQQENLRKMAQILNESQAIFKQKSIEDQKIVNGLAALNAKIELCKEYGFEPDEDFYVKAMTGQNIGQPTCNDFLKNAKKIYYTK